MKYSPFLMFEFMVYKYLRLYAKFILRFFVRNIEVQGLENFSKKTALLIASNHPNSFFDAVVEACILDRPVHPLTRGDAFKNPMANKFLSSINMLPIFRISEGIENMGKNDKTFEKCNEVFNNNGAVLIFSEGLCAHQKTLLPLKKGTGRMALQSWQQGSDLEVLPVSIKYDSFSNFGKNIKMNIGKSIIHEDFADLEPRDGVFVSNFNIVLSNRLKELSEGELSPPKWNSNLIYWLGWLVNFPLYLLLSAIVKSKTRGTVFYDSILYGAILLTLPFYWLILGLLLAWIF